MTLIPLTARERSELEIIATHGPSARECRRAQSLLWLDAGEAVEAVSELLGVSRQTVYNWLERFRVRDGCDLPARLGDAPRLGRPRAGEGAVDSLIAVVIDTDPRDLGYHQTVWTAPLLSRHLRKRHRITASARTVSRALARLDIRWKRPRHQLARRPETWRQSKGG